MANYTPCEGTGKAAVNTRRVVGAEGKFFRLNGVTFGHCPTCGRTGLRVGDAKITPAHKDALPAWVRAD